MNNFKLIAVFVVFLSLPVFLNAQVSIAPSFVFLDSNSGVGNLYVSNNSDQPQEVTVSFAFGYPASDADGNLVMNYEDSIAYKEFALDEMIRAFPRSFVLGGGEQRTVRIQLMPSERSKEGYFFTRMKVLAKAETEEVSEEVTEGIGTKISFNFEQVTAVFYRKGEVSTGLNLTKLDVQQNDDILELRPHLQRTGNAPFLGSMFAILKDSNGNVVAESQSTTTAYFDVIRRLEIALEDVAPGTYKLELGFKTQRNDMMETDLVQAPEFTHETMVEIK